MKYLLVTLIPFYRSSEGAAIVDGLWAEDLRGLFRAVGNVTVAAPETKQKATTKGWWGTGESALHEADGVRFVGLPSFHNPVEAWLGAFRLRSILRREILKADMVHSSNFYTPYLGLAYAHRLAVKKGKKTIFVVAEDFQDFMEWTFAAGGLAGLRRMRSMRLLQEQDRLTRQCLSSASISFLHTPAAVQRYRLSAPRGLAIRQPVHQTADVVSMATLADRASRANRGEPLRLVVASRLAPLKGTDFLLRAVQFLKAQQISVTVDIYGAGPEKAQLVRLAKILDVEDRVIFYDGLANGPAFRKALERHDLSIMAHLTTDFGRAFWDAMAAGLPVVAFHSEAASHTVRDRLDGLLAPMADVEGLADRIRQAHYDRTLLQSMSLAARERALVNTRSVWNELRAARIKELMLSSDESESTEEPRSAARAGLLKSLRQRLSNTHNQGSI
jgi:glycosyltransferase involved in cell wall biosynthesis